MENISIIYFYPNFIKVNNEINLIRIIDNKLKESLIIFLNVDEISYKLNVTNTNFGVVDTVFSFKNFSRLDKIIKIIQDKEIELKNLKDLGDIETHIKNIIN